MHQQPNLPGEAVVADEEFTVSKAWSVNSWLILATVISALCDVIFSPVMRPWPIGWRLAILLAEFAAVMLWARRLNRWIRGMDEMHRQIVVKNFLFSVSVTLLFTLLWLRLEVGGYFDALVGRHTGFGMGTLAFAALVHSIAYAVGHFLIFNRRAP